MAPTSNLIKILHIDRDMPFLEVTSRILKLIGDFEVDTAQSISEANTALNQKKYDVIISAFYLNGIDGLEYQKQLYTKGIHTPFILFTINDETAKEAKKAHIPFISKYGDPEQVFSQLAQTIKISIK